MSKDDQLTHLKNIENNAVQMQKQVKQEKAIDDFVKLTTPGNSENSFVWDMGAPEPEEIEGILAEKSLTPVIIKITSQPFFGKLKVKADNFGYMDKTEIEPAEIPDINLREAAGRANMTGIQQKFMNRRYQAVIEAAMDTKGSGLINQITNPTEEIKPMTKLKCDRCTQDEARLSYPHDIQYLPEKCATCLSNPAFTDNFEAMTIPWPPEENQEVWIISSKGDVFETIYNSVDWQNLVNVYPTQKSAETSRDVLLNARKLPNECSND